MERTAITKSIIFRVVVFSVTITCILIAIMIINTQLVTQKLMTEHNKEISRISVDVIESKFEENYKLMQVLIGQIIDNQEIIDAFANRDRLKLAELTIPSMTEFHEIGIGQYQFHLPNGNSFFRVHLPDAFDDDLSGFRHTVVSANSTQEVAYGLEKGVAGTGFRYVKPVTYAGKHLGSIELGISLQKNTLEILKSTIGGEWYFYETDGMSSALVDSTADEEITYEITSNMIDRIKNDETVYLTPEHYLMQIIPLKDFSGEIIGFLLRVYDNSQAMTVAVDQRNSNILFGLIIGLTGTLAIVTTLRHLLTESNELFKTLADFANDWIFWRSPQGEIIYSSPACESITGYTQGEFINYPQLFNEIVTPEERSDWLSHVHQADSLGNPQPLEFGYYYQKWREKMDKSRL